VRYTLLRHATALLEFGGKRFLIDPMLDPAGARPPVPNTPNQHANPLVDLPPGWEQLVARADTLLVTHLHQDHVDTTATRTLDHNLPLYAQPADAARLAALGFWDLHPVSSTVACDGITITRTPAQHGTGDIAIAMAPVSGFLLEHAGEPTLYIASDTIWCDDVAATIARHQPDVIVLNASGARFLEGDPIVMTAEDVAEAHRAAPEAMLIVVHLEAINHCLETRAHYRSRLRELGVDMKRVLIPLDGESVSAFLGQG
jgi:L-ascorbate metabolism protein UlaG (beta-lactamase superfamily)